MPIIIFKSSLKDYKLLFYFIVGLKNLISQG